MLYNSLSQPLKFLSARYFLANQWPSTAIEVRLMACCMCFYVLLYSSTMVCTTLDVYLAVCAPLWHRLNVGRREVFLSVLSVALVGALGTGILGVLAPDTMFAYNPTIYMSSFAFDLSSMLQYYPVYVPLDAMLNATTFCVITLNVLTFARLKRLARERFQLGVRPQPPVIVLSQSQPASQSLYNIENQQFCDRYQSHQFHGESYEMNTLHNQSPITENLPGRRNYQDYSRTAYTSRGGLQSGHKHDSSSRKFKLTFFMSIRYIIMFAMADVVFIVLYLLKENDNSMAIAYVLYLNGIGDYLLYDSFNPRYWMGSVELQTKFLAFIFRIDRNRYPKVRRLVACGFNII